MSTWLHQSSFSSAVFVLPTQLTCACATVCDYVHIFTLIVCQSHRQRTDGVSVLAWTVAMLCMADEQSAPISPSALISRRDRLRVKLNTWTECCCKNEQTRLKPSSHRLWWFPSVCVWPAHPVQVVTRREMLLAAHNILFSHLWENFCTCLFGALQLTEV